MPAGASTEQPVTMLPSIKAVGAKRRWTWPSAGGFFMQMHVGHASRGMKGRDRTYFASVIAAAAVQRPIFLANPDCAARIPCYTAASRLPALVRRSEHQETAMTDFKYSLTNLKPAEPS